MFLYRWRDVMLKSLNYRLFFILLVFFLSAPGAFALEANEIVDRANATAYYQGKDGRASVKMVITDSQGRSRRVQSLF